MRNIIVIDFEDKQLQDLITTLIRENFEPYLTSVGGSGLGILSPYPQHRTRGGGGSRVPRHAPEELGQVTPPDTPMPREPSPGPSVDGPEKGPHELDPLRAPFLSQSVAELPEWATGLGRWLYV